MRVMLRIKGAQPGAAPSQELLAAMGSTNDELNEAGVLINLAGLLPWAERSPFEACPGSTRANTAPRSGHHVR
jgi:hypothetical protein